MRHMIIGMAFAAAATAAAVPSFAQSVGPDPYANQPYLNENGLPPGYDNDAILPNNDRDVPDSARSGDNAPVGAFGNPRPGPVYPAPGYEMQPMKPGEPMAPPQ